MEVLNHTTYSHLPGVPVLAIGGAKEELGKSMLSANQGISYVQADGERQGQVIQIFLTALQRKDPRLATLARKTLHDRKLYLLLKQVQQCNELAQKRFTKER